ncbi:DNA-3-methyladenine glycosylase 2 family protein [Acidithiobacillus thiooxidans]|uniref:DNA-3-methyladenine glycosylase family protein n=1 Tax=Acidithiobacillus thiooxidans TaxID=930 RepID=UPI001C076D31|nr:DNA-3-methyladenine glycosylase [Acidithiobacillus thiooxidans]MBU2751322.1 DNA-3-methyladenine glycosylase 2 family protein [Acidithiobacillus thiooxidans]
MKAKVTDPMAGGHRVTLPLPVDPPFSFRWAMEYLSSSPSTVLENVDPHAGLQRVLYLHGRHVLLVLRSASEDVEHPALFVEMHSERKISRAICDAGLHWARNTLNLDQNPHDFLELGKRDAPIRQLQEQFRGMRPVRLASPYESLIWAIIGQQIHVAFARRLKYRFLEHCGDQVQIDGHQYPVFPEPEQVLRADLQELAALQFSRQKSAYIAAVSAAVADGRLNFEAISTLPQEQAISHLTKFRGIGRWTAEYVLMRGLGYLDCIPAADIGLRKAAGELYGLGRTASEKEVRDITEPFQGWRSWVAFYWWMALQQNNQSAK